MVRKLNKERKEHYQCEECGLIYKDENIAEKCEKWCKKNKSCKLEITKYAVKGIT